MTWYATSFDDLYGRVFLRHCGVAAMDESASVAYAPLRRFSGDMVTVPKTPAEARPVLEQLAAQRDRCTMFVLGDGRQDIATTADLRATGHPFRRVAWLPNPAVMSDVSDFESVSAAHTAGGFVVTMTADFAFSSSLSDADTVDFVALEEAFIKAETGG